MSIKIIAKNKKAYFNFAIEEEIEAGIMLVGSEVKSLREGKCSINEAYAAESSGALYLMNAMIAEFAGANKFNHEPTRRRKLLLHKKELDKIIGKMAQKGYSLLALQFHFRNGRAKVLLGLGKGKKLYDKRASIKERDLKREMAREG